MKTLKYIVQISFLKTMYANFKLLPLKTALKFPIIIGKKVKLDLHGKVVIENPKIKMGMISIGIGGSSDLRYFNPRNSYFGIENAGVLIFKGKAHFAVHSSLLVTGATMVIGSGFSCNNGTKISCACGIEIADNCLIGTNVLIMDSDGHRIFENGALHPNKLKISIGNHVWLTSGVSVLKGTAIADEVVVAFGSTVTKNLTESNTICAGTPAKIIKRGITWER